MRPTFTNLLVVASFSECYTADFACQILAAFFSKRYFRGVFLCPLRFLIFGFIRFLPNLAQLLMKGCSTNLFRLFNRFVGECV